MTTLTVSIHLLVKELSLIGLDPTNPLKSTSLGVFIIPKGGEYFFSPSISGLKSTIAKEYISLVPDRRTERGPT